MKTIKCKCPKCEEIRNTVIKWRGNGMPRIFCSNCKISIKKIYAETRENIFEKKEK